MDQAKSADEQEDREHWPDRRGDEIPAHIKDKMRKLVQVQGGQGAAFAGSRGEGRKAPKPGGDPRLLEDPPI